MSNSLILILITSTISLFSCAKSPIKEQTEAKAAIKAAQEAEADIYMSKNYKNLLKAMEAAEAEIKLQNNSFFLSRKYSRATKMLLNVKSFALEIRKEAPRAKEEMAEAVESNLSLIKEVFKITSDNIKKASCVKNRNIITVLKTDLKSADSAATCAAADFKAGKILDASNSLNYAQNLISDIIVKMNGNSSTVQFDEAEVQ